MKDGLLRWWWVALLLIAAAGLARLRFDADVLDLLHGNLPEVHGLKVYQEYFANSRELIITIQAPDAEGAKSTAQAIALHLRRATNLVADATWQPPWQEHPEQMAELIAYLWLNQPPEVFGKLAQNLAPTNLPNVLASTKDKLSTTLSPADLAQLSYDPFGLTQLPEAVARAAPAFGRGDGMFASADGTFRIIFVKAASDLAGYTECAAWLSSVKTIVETSISSQARVEVHYTGRPAFVEEISASMKHDIILSVGGTACIIALLFWMAHRRLKPMLWLMTLLALILVTTLGIGSLLLGTINVISMGFAAILLGLAVDYAVVHYQEALSYPELTIPEIRRAIAPAIFWAAMTTISAFLALNFGGLPGLSQLGSLVAIGIALAALVMILAFLPPLFPGRMIRHGPPPPVARVASVPEPLDPAPARLAFAATGLLVLLSAAILSFGWPKLDSGIHAMEPRHSQAYAALDVIAKNLGQKQDPLWLVVSGRDEAEVARRLAETKPALDNAVARHLLDGFTLPDVLWPHPDAQSANRAAARRLAAEAAAMKSAALANGFTTDATLLDDKILDTWRRAASVTNTFWPTNDACRWIFEKIAARGPDGFFAAGFLYPAGPITPGAIGPLPAEGVWLSGWSLLGRSVLGQVKHNLWKLVPMMVALALLCLWLAFGRAAEIALSLTVLLVSGLCLLAVMKLAGWSWNALNLMSVPLLLGTGVDYSLFMQLALRRHGGSLGEARRSVGRALLLCGGAAVAGFGSLGLSSNAGMASLGQVCAAGLAGNMLISIYLLPSWWKALAGRNQTPGKNSRNAPPPLYSGLIWKAGMILARVIPSSLCRAAAKFGAGIYWRLASRRREVVISNLRPVLKDEAAAQSAARALFTQFALKIEDLWRYEAGINLDRWDIRWKGWEHFVEARAKGRGVLLVTPHLGNWEIGGAYLPRKGIPLLVLTQAEPDPRLTELRQAARALRGVETLVVGQDAFAFIEIIKRLQNGATVALLMDRPAATSAVHVQLFGRPFTATIAAAELARASGCAILPSFILRTDFGYAGEIFPEILYDRAEIGNRAARVRLTQEIMRVFEPGIAQYATQWYHFVPIWPEGV